MSRKKQSNRVFDCAVELDLISKAKTQKRRVDLIKNAKDCVIDAISEIALNCLKGNFPLKECDFKKLKKYKTILRRLALNSPVNIRRKLIEQRGGILPLIIPPALGFLGTLATKYLIRKFKL